MTAGPLAVGECSTGTAGGGRKRQSSARSLASCGGAARRDVWATGGEGEVHHWDGARWSSVPALPKTTLTDIRGRAADDVWAVAAGGHTFHFDGRAWSESATGTERSLAAVWVAPGGEVWTVGERGTILRRVVR